MRNNAGSSLVELLITSLIMSFIASATVGILCTFYADSIKVENKCDSITQARNALDKVTRSVRMGRSVGDVYGAFDTTEGVLTGSDSFPGLVNNQPRNPVYGAGQTPPNGWPVWADGSRPSSFTLSNTCLIVQLPVFDANGFPYCIPAGSGDPPATTAVDNVETDIYRVVPDPQNQGEWILQWARLPGLDINGYVGQQTGPTTLCKGIVGPLNNGVPRIFQFLDRTDVTRTPQDTVDANKVSCYSGVIINLAIDSHSASANPTLKNSSIALKSEVFLRNNAQATTTGVPTPIQ